MITLKDHIKGMKQMFFNKRYIGLLTQMPDGFWYLGFCSDVAQSFLSEETLTIILNEIKKLNQK